MNQSLVKVTNFYINDVCLSTTLCTRVYFTTPASITGVVLGLQRFSQDNIRETDIIKNFQELSFVHKVFSRILPSLEINIWFFLSELIIEISK